MAYSLGDPYRSLRTVLRLNGVLLGLLLGAAFLLGAPRLLAALGILLPAEGTVPGLTLGWRVAGAGLMGAGALLLAAATRPELERATLFACAGFHALLAVVLLAGYLRGGLAASNPLAVIVLVGAFVLCLLGALAPLRYFGPEYRS